MLKNQLTTLLIILSSFVLNIDCKSEILKLERNIKFRGEPVQNALSVLVSEIKRNETKIRALNDIKRFPSPNVTNSTISIDGEVEKIAREHDVDHGSYSGENYENF